MPEPTARLVARISRDFPVGVADEVTDRLRRLPESACDGQDCERVQAALIFAAGGDWSRFVALLQLLDRDWRDVLVAGDLADSNWPHRLNRTLTVVPPGRAPQRRRRKR
jgi:hypothetical protein